MNLPFDRHDDDSRDRALHQLVGAYALDALPVDERVLFEAWLDERADDDTRAEVLGLVATATMLAEEASTAPPPGLRDRVLAMADQTRQLPPVVSDLAAERASRRPTLGRIPMIAASAAAAVALVIGTATVVSDRFEDRLQLLEEAAVTASTAELVDVLGADDVRVVRRVLRDGPDATLVLSTERGEAVFMVKGLTPAPEGMAYELWLVRGSVPTRAGLFDADPMGRAAQSVAADLSDVTAVAVTMEPAGGSDVPTSMPMVVLELT